MKILLLTVLLGIFSAQDTFEDLISEKVSEEYCNDVIGNMTALLNESYVYLDFLKAPKQPDGKEDYITTVDLISELNNIKKTDRTFYEFYQDIHNIIRKARDGHLIFSADETPNGFDLSRSVFCIPFYLEINEIHGEDQKVTDIYYSISYPFSYGCKGFSQEIINKAGQLYGKKILKINDKEPIEFLEERGKKYFSSHSSQCRYIEILDNFNYLYVQDYPLAKEDLTLSFKFEGVEEEFKIEYQFNQLSYFSEEFKQYFLKEKEKYYKNSARLPKLEDVELKFKKKKGLIQNNNLKQYGDFWDLESDDYDLLKCRVDEENQLNVLYQEGFSPDDFDNYEEIMYQCLSKFYSNDYKIVVIENRNGGGKTELCIPLTQYMRPQILKTKVNSFRASELIYKAFFINDENLNPETCFPFTEKDNILEGKTDIYSDGKKNVIHKKTKIIEGLNIYEKKIMETKRKEYARKKTKKPTEVLVFTDGYSFSCASDFIRGLQVQGYGIIVGYNAKPNIDKSDFDASQSNSGVDRFRYSIYSENLQNLGITPYITYTEAFDPNDENDPKIPMEWQIYPVDEISDIYTEYEIDDSYDRFIGVAKSIFEKYNEKGECNPDNKFLFYETEECDSKLKIDKARGGYICGEDGKWDTSKCIAAYCQEGYILNDERTECIPDPCDAINLKEIILTEEKNYTYIIEPNNAYIFSIQNDNCSYYFYSEFEKFFYIFNERHILEPVENGTLFQEKIKIYANYFVNISENTQITISTKPINDSDINPDEPEEEPQEPEEESEEPEEESEEPEEESEEPEEESDNSHNNSDDKKTLSKNMIALIVIISILVIIGIILFVIFCCFKNKRISNEEIEKKSEQLYPLNI